MDMESKGKRKRGIWRIFAALLAAISGGVNALFGGGGGMLAVPALRHGLDVDERRAHASAIAVMLPLSTISAVAFTVRGVYDVNLGINVGMGAVIGGVMGAMLLKKVPKALLSILFYGVMIYAGIRFLV